MRNPDPYPVGLQQWIDEQIRSHGTAWAWHGDHEFQHVDEDAIIAALADYRLEMANGNDVRWLAMAVRRVLAIVSLRPVGMPDTVQGNATTRDNLDAIARRSRHLADDIEALGMPEMYAVTIAAGDLGGWAVTDAIGRLRFTAAILEAGARTLKPDTAKWRAAAVRELRIRRAHYLSPVFEIAFDCPAVVNDRPGAADLGPWPDFYERIIRTATGERVQGLREAVKEARKRHRDTPVSYPAEVIPAMNAQGAIR